MTSATIDEEMRDLFIGNFMDSSDILAKGNVTVVISDVIAPNKEKDGAGKTINKAILAFEKATKRLIMNKTNCKIVAMMYGQKPSQWIGKPITLCVRYLEKAFGQTNVPVVRVLPPADKPLTFGMRRSFGSDVPFVKDR